MKSIRKKIESAILSDDPPEMLGLETALNVMSAGYGLGVGLRGAAFDRNIVRTRCLPVKVLSIGNITVGGTGKTPMTVHVAQILKAMGRKVAVVSRGYRGDAERKGGIVHDGTKSLMTPHEAGDEPWMTGETLKTVPVIVGQNRYVSGMLAKEKFDTEVIILDDGFQHRKLHRDVDIVLLDCLRPFGNGHLLPRGPLREDFSALLRTHAIVLTRSDIDPDFKKRSLNRLEKITGNSIPVFTCLHRPRIIKIIRKGGLEETADVIKNAENGQAGWNEFLKNRPVYAFSGIAKNDDFLKSLKTSFQCHIAGFSAFPDHYAYTDLDIDALSGAAEKCRAKLMVTTEKDYVRLAGRISGLPVDLAVIGIDIAFVPDDIAFKEFLIKTLKI
ncbi:tetraacyldisaccharide 4'-kinase [Desulfobacterales bacterium HSG16]|nr:tetraacyldisaccharide 4'-kinase [Desulfobacterales bacterium HSG16]